MPLILSSYVMFISLMHLENRVQLSNITFYWHYLQPFASAIFATDTVPSTSIHTVL